MDHIENFPLLHHLAKVPDPRLDRQKRHNLVDILAIAILGTICDCNTWTDIEYFGLAAEDWLKTFLELPNGIPSHDTFGRVFRHIDSKALQTAFNDWVKTLHQWVSQEVISIDGKCLRGSHDKANGKAAIHMVSAWADANQLILGQVKTDAKSNEIKAIPELLNMLAIKGCIVTIDAAGCQKKIAEQIQNQGGDYVLAVKGNQPNLHEEIRNFFDKTHSVGRIDIPISELEQTDAGHGRVEVRRHWIAEDLSWMYVREKWKGIRFVGMVESERHIDGKVSTERRYYISSMKPDVEKFAKAVRSHWGIENKVHWCLDVTFDEDRSRTRKDHAPENLAVLRRMALIAVKRETSRKISNRAKRKVASWSKDYLIKVLSAT